MSDGPRRDGDTVRRPVRPNTALVLDVLRRLEAAGATWAPRSRGIDDGFEVLSWLDGDTPADGDDSFPLKVKVAEAAGQAWSPKKAASASADAATSVVFARSLNCASPAM